MYYSKLTMKWYYFFTFFSMPLAILSSFVGLFELNNIYNNTYASQVLGRAYLLLFETYYFWLIIGTAILIFLLISKNKLIIKFLDYYLFFSSFFSAYIIAIDISNYDVEFWFYYIISFIVLFFCWIYPNHIYFKKREKLFVGKLFNLKKNQYNDLIALKQLLDKNIITQEEFENEKKKILNLDNLSSQNSSNQAKENRL